MNLVAFTDTVFTLLVQLKRDCILKARRRHLREHGVFIFTIDYGETDRAVLVGQAAVETSFFHHDLTAAHEIIQSQFQLRHQLLVKLVLIDKLFCRHLEASLVLRSEDEAALVQGIL